jgi:hypothetical protein
MIRAIQVLFVVALQLLLLCATSRAQEATPAPSRWQLTAALTQNAANLGNPFGGGVLHPGLSLGANVRLNQHATHQFLALFHVRYLYHQDIQHAIPVTAEIGYRWRTPIGVAVAPVLGGGYVHAIPDMPSFRMENGAYERVRNWGHPNWAITTGVNVGYKAPKMFIRQTSPILAYTSLNVGAAFPLKR